MNQPPAKVGAGTLFRLLLQVPRATQEIAYRVREADDIALHVQALRGIEIAEAMSTDHGPYGIIAASVVLDDGRRAFPTWQHVAMLAEHEYYRLHRQIKEALDTISPAYWWSDAVAWGKCLAEGAGANQYEAFALGNCYDASYGYGVGRHVPRPDRYFGMPIRELTDGHWMVYHAAREFVEKRIPKPKQQSRGPMLMPRKKVG